MSIPDANMVREAWEARHDDALQERVEFYVKKVADFFNDVLTDGKYTGLEPVLTLVVPYIHPVETKAWVIVLRRIEAKGYVATLSVSRGEWQVRWKKVPDAPRTHSAGGVLQELSRKVREGIEGHD
jgi:hypothetical protein